MEYLIKGILKYSRRGLVLEHLIKWVIKYSRRGLLGEIFDKLRIRGRMQFFMFLAVIHVFESLIDGFRSWECRNRRQTDLLYIFDLPNPQKVHSTKTLAGKSTRKGLLGRQNRLSQKVDPQGAFGQNIS